MSRFLRVAVAGLGRMGKRHALHFLQSTPRAHLVAAFTPDPAEIAWAKEHLEPFGVRIYTDYTALIAAETKPFTDEDSVGGLQAMVVATATTVHAEETIEAIEAGLHVLCEKPLSTNIEIAAKVVETAQKYPKQKVLCGFSRRFDTSYRDAKAKVESGAIGNPAIFRSQTCDKLDPSGFFVAYAEFSGGIFVDCNIHDIDLALWFFGDETPIKSISAVGVTAVQPDLAKHGDVDNGVGVVEFWGNKIAYFYSSRMMASGQHDMTEIIGTEGKITVNQNPIGTLVDLWEATGIRKEIPQDYYGRFREAFITEANEFTEACLDDKPLKSRLQGALSALVIGSVLQESLRSGKKIYFDEKGQRLPEA
ncbi:hypothetical protein F503_04464 [Ophiostoma piceae UAMH 11346]|uniref:Nad-binding rossmann fold oxidoreductase family protein n=1 Tax=Ophiostoma piceae (strain UAMH 11346) TaxID=1262450 RepID=S3C7S8_OPHP1|nr:hypothetical protein F503_04464 [Ophiostoma piceae UAMH 11346]